MPKLKTKKSIQKRLRITKTGKVMRLKKSWQHNARHASKSSRHQANQPTQIIKVTAKKLTALLNI